MSLRWGGDYSIPRFRAKLAEKYNMDPVVEPAYEEIYRPELGGRTIVRRVPCNPRPGGLSASASAGSLQSMGGMRHSSSTPSLSKSRGSGALPQLVHDSSVPKLGVRRMDAFTKKPFESSSPTAPLTDDQKRDADKLAKIVLASKQLWTAMGGAEEMIKKEVSLRQNEGVRGKAMVPFMKDVKPPLVQAAISGGASIDWKNDEWDGSTLLLKAVRNGYFEMVVWLLAKDADHTILDNAGRSALHWAAVEGGTKIMDFLLTVRPLEAEKNEVLRESQSFNVAYFQEEWPDKTTYSRDPSVIQAFLNVPDSIAADMSKIEHTVFKADAGGDTPLHLACYSGHSKIVRLLVAAKADVHLQNAAGFTPLDLAVARKHPWPGEETAPPVYRSRPLRPAPPGRSTAVARYLREKTEIEADMKELGEDETDLGLAKLWRPCDLVRIAEIEKERDDPWGMDPTPLPDPSRIEGIRKEVQDRLKAHAQKLNGREEAQT